MNVSSSSPAIVSDSRAVQFENAAFPIAVTTGNLRLIKVVAELNALTGTSPPNVVPVRSTFAKRASSAQSVPITEPVTITVVRV